MKQVGNLPAGNGGASRPGLSAGVALAGGMAIVLALGGCQVFDRPLGARGSVTAQNADAASNDGDAVVDAQRPLRGEVQSAPAPVPQRAPRGSVVGAATAPGVEELNRGRILQDQGLLEDALTQFNKAIEENPLLTTAHMGAGNIKMAMGDLSGAEESFRTAAAQEPFNFNAQYWHGVVLHQLQKLDAAIRAYLRALQLRPDSFEANNNLGAAYLQAGEAREALPYAQRAVEINPDDAAARTNLGAIYAALNDHEAAITEYQQAAELTDLTPELLLNLAESYGRTRRFEEMVNTLDEVIRLNPSAAAYERMGSGLFRLGRFDEALEAFRAGVKADDTHFPAHNGVAVCLLQEWLASGQTDKDAKEQAMKALRRSLQIRRDQPRVLELIGRFQ